MPALQVLPTTDVTRSYLGGDPCLGEGTEWPTLGGAPLAFIACLDLESLGEVLEIAWLPSSGRLLFFYDTEKQPWGFDPNHRGGWAVLHDERQMESVATSTVTVSPSLPQQCVSFREVRTFPGWERPELSHLQLSDSEVSHLIDLCESVYGSVPSNQIGGFPAAVQGDQMELECQLVSHGIYCGDSSGYSGTRAERLEAGAKDWRLLLQIVSDEGIGTMWGDDGILYFWIREQDAREGRFENVWTILQSC